VSAEPLVCPRCAAPASAEERFCDACGMPLVIAPVEGIREPTERQERARKIKRQYSEGPLIRVAVGRHQAEAELIQGLLLEHGVPSVHKRSAGFDVPEFSGPRDVFVPQSGEEAAREVLTDVEAEHAAAGGTRGAVDGEPAPRRATRSTRTLAIGLSLCLGLLSLVPAAVILSRAYG